MVLGSELKCCKRNNNKVIKKLLASSQTLQTICKVLSLLKQIQKLNLVSKFLSKVGLIIYYNCRKKKGKKDTIYF